MSAQQHENTEEDNMSSNRHVIYKGGRINKSDRENKEVESVNIDTNVIAVEERAFWNCTNLKRVTFPDTSSVTSIGEEAFAFCESLQHINLPSSITTIEEEAFSNCYSLQSVILPSSISVIPKEAFKECISLTTINIPNTVTSIGEYAFYMCESLKSISIPPSVATIEKYAFYYCTNLKDVNISSQTKLGNKAFLHCSNLNKTLIQRFTNEFTNNLSLSDSFQHGTGPSHNFKGQTQKGWGPEYCGMTLDQIKDVLNHPCIDNNTSMRDVVRLLVKPATKQQGVSYALLLNQEKPLHANVMVSHAWDEPIGQFVKCLEQSGEEGAFWICAFAIYQSGDDNDGPTITQQLGTDPEYGPFAMVLRGATSMVAVITETCDIYTRLWCVYELSIAQKLNVKVILCPHMRDEYLKWGYLYMDVCIKNIKIRVDSKHAHCSWDPDKNAIHAAIQPFLSLKDGFLEINIIVETFRLEYLLTYRVDKIGFKCHRGKKERVEEYLVSRIILMVETVHSIKADELPKINDYYDESEFETWDNLSEESCEERQESGSVDPVTKAFRDWTNDIKDIITERNSKKSGCLNLFTNNCR